MPTFFLGKIEVPKDISLKDGHRRLFISIYLECKLFMSNIWSDEL